MICSIIKKIQLFLTKMEELNLTSIERIDTAPPFQSKAHIYNYYYYYYQFSILDGFLNPKLFVKSELCRPKAQFLVFFSILNRLRIEKKTKNIYFRNSSFFFITRQFEILIQAWFIWDILPAEFVSSCNIAAPPSQICFAFAVFENWGGDLRSQNRVRFMQETYNPNTENRSAWKGRIAQFVVEKLAPQKENFLGTLMP